MKNKTYFIFLFIFLGSQLQAQKEINYSIPRLRLEVEGGVNLLFAEMNISKQIRESQSYFFDKDHDFYNGFVRKSGTIYTYQAAVKLEYVLTKRWTVASGLRFSFHKAELTSGRGYFLWKASETETATNFVKIKNIFQNNYYLGIPIEFKLYPREKDYFVRQYFLFGGALNFLVASEKKVEFQNKNMEKYSSAVKKHIGTPNIFHGNIYLGVGLKIGKSNYPVGNLEVILPVLTIGQYNKNTFAKIIAAPGIGVRAKIQIPLLKKNPLTYTVID